MIKTVKIKEQKNEEKGKKKRKRNPKSSRDMETFVCYLVLRQLLGFFRTPSNIKGQFQNFVLCVEFHCVRCRLKMSQTKEKHNAISTMQSFC